MEVVTTDDEYFRFVFVGSDEDGLVGELGDGQIIFMPYSGLSTCRTLPASGDRTRPSHCRIVP